MRIYDTFYTFSLICEFTLNSLAHTARGHSGSVVTSPAWGASPTPKVSFCQVIGKLQKVYLSFVKLKNV